MMMMMMIMKMISMTIDMRFINDADDDDNNNDDDFYDDYFSMTIGISRRSKRSKS